MELHEFINKWVGYIRYDGRDERDDLKAEMENDLNDAIKSFLETKLGFWATKKLMP